jgi:hypothetical protein
MALETGEAEPAMLPPLKKADTLAKRYWEAESVVKSTMSIAKILGTALPMAKAIAVEDARRLTGIECAHLLPPAQIEEIPVGIKRLAEIAETPLKELSTLMQKAGLFLRDEKGNITITEKAKELKAGSAEPYKSKYSNHSGYQVKWFPSVVMAIIKETDEVTP